LDQATAIKQRAQALIQRGALKEAMAEYEKLLGLEPINPYAYILLGDLAVRMGMRNEALKRYSHGVDAYESQHLYRNAIAVLKKVQRLDPTQIANLRRIADLYAKEGLVAESVAHYLDYATRRLQSEGGKQASLEVLQIVSRLGAASSEVAVRVADLFLKVGDPDGAASELVRVAVELEGRGQTDRAQALRARAAGIAPGRHESQAAAPSAAIKPSPEAPAVEAFNVMPGLKRAGTLFAPVEAAAPQGPLLDPSEVMRASEGFAAGHAGEQALHSIDEGLRPFGEEDANGNRMRAGGEPMAPGAPTADQVIAEARGMGLPDLSGSEAEASVIIQNPLPNLATAESQGLESDVARIFERFRQGVAPQLGTQDHASHYNLGITYMGMGVFAEAVAEFQQAMEGEGYRRRCHEMLATCYSRLDRPELAAGHWRAAIQEAGNSEGEPALHYELACALAAAGQIEEARKELGEVLRRDPSFAAARTRLEALGA
jgi:tetratricopeptide (TPR) repeat protein